jgi:hypothetical protein
VLDAARLAIVEYFEVVLEKVRDRHSLIIGNGERNQGVNRSHIHADAILRVLGEHPAGAENDTESKDWKDCGAHVPVNALYGAKRRNSTFAHFFSSE